MAALPLVTQEEYDAVIQANAPLFEEIARICEASGEAVEGNCFYLHKRIDMPLVDLLPKQMNLFSLGRIARTVLEIGFNAGHSTLLFLLANPASSVVCFDLCEHKYTRPCFEFLASRFPGRVELYAGDSLKTVPRFIAENPGRMFDLVHIDGCHEAAVADGDFWNCYGVARRWILWDDTQMEALNSLLNKYIGLGLVKEVAIYPTGIYRHRAVVVARAT